VQQSAHGPGVAQRYYIVDGAFLNFLRPKLVNRYTQVLRAWHAFFEATPDKGAAAAVAVAARLKHGRGASQQLQPALVKREKSVLRRKDSLEGVRGTAVYHRCQEKTILWQDLLFGHGITPPIFANTLGTQTLPKLVTLSCVDALMR
jgi:hypothetical protein